METVSIFLTQESGVSGNIEKEPQKSRPKLLEIIYKIFTDNIWSACSLVFYKPALIL